MSGDDDVHDAAWKCRHWQTRTTKDATPWIRCERDQHPTSSYHWNEHRGGIGGVDWTTGSKRDVVVDTR